MLPGFAKSIQPTLNVGGAWKIYSFAWIFGFTSSMFSYYVICTYISSPTESIIEEAVYPPQKGDVSPSSVEGEETEASKVEYITKEKEVSPV